VFFGFGWEGIADRQVRQVVLMRVLGWLQGGMSAVDDGTAPVSPPVSWHLEPNYPNPFNPSTHIRFALATAGKVRVLVLNPLGQVVKTLVDMPLSQGHHEVEWDGTDDHGNRVASGVYLYQLVAGEVRLTRKCVLLY
jgi:hypothetical protein